MTEIDREQVAFQFSRAAPTYDTVTSLQQAMGSRLLSAIPPEATGRLVDLGCGTGWLLRELQQRRPRLQISGLDLAPGMIEHARRLIKVPLICGDLEQTGITTSAMDWVLSNATLQWCDLDRALVEIRRILAPGGTLLLSTFIDGTLESWRDVWHQVDEQSPHVHQFLTSELIQQKLGQAGFRIDSLEPHRSVQRFRTPAELLDSIRKSGTGYAGMDRNRTPLSRSSYQQLNQILDQLARVDRLQLEYYWLAIGATAPVESDFG